VNQTPGIDLSLAGQIVVDLQPILCLLHAATTSILATTRRHSVIAIRKQR